MEGSPIDLGGGYALRAADSVEFARFHALYRPDPMLSGEAALNLFCPGVPCVWIERQGTRVGGCLAGNGVLGEFFTMPPFEAQGEVLRRITLYVKADAGRRIFAHGIRQDEFDDYLRLGFRMTAPIAAQLDEPDYTWQMMRAMARPTQKLPAHPCQAALRAPRKSDMGRIATLLAQAYGGADPLRQQESAFREDLQQFFSQNEKALRAASSLAARDGELIGACLIVRWEGVPLIFDIAVVPNARMGGVARAMITHALSVLEEADESRLQLFLECGNPAASLYHAMGFIGAPLTTSMYID